jgi:DNA (cytosine-5)-methyltransferase 1
VSGLIIDSFAGGGGASLGIEMALGRGPDVAINHDPEAVSLHRANHPRTRHYCESVWEVDPKDATAGKDVALAWFSPDCKHFSKAKGGKPVEKAVRGLAWVVQRWAAAVRPAVICLENVEEFKTWGPLVDGRPCPRRKGETFNRWVDQLAKLGYDIEWRELRAADYNTPTTRKRLFVVARCDRRAITWPTPTHGAGRLPYRAAAECIDWSIPVPSIFGRKKPLAEATLRRIARGIHRYVIGVDTPFIVPVTHQGDTRVHGLDVPMPTITAAHRGELALIAPTLVQTSYGEREGQAPRCLDLQAPLGTVVAGGVKHALVAAFLAKHYGGNETPGSDLRRPLDTVTTQDHHALVHAFLTRYNGIGDGQGLQDPLGTVTTRDRFGIVTVHGEAYTITDIGMRMLAPRELYRAQGFPDRYRIDVLHDGAPLSKTAQVRMCGNSVCPPLAAAVVGANVERQGRRTYDHRQLELGRKAA